MLSASSAKAERVADEAEADAVALLLGQQELAERRLREQEDVVKRGRAAGETDDLLEAYRSGGTARARARGSRCEAARHRGERRRGRPHGRTAGSCRHPVGRVDAEHGGTAACWGEVGLGRRKGLHVDRYDEINARGTARSIWTVATVLLVIYAVGGVIYAAWVMSLPSTNASRGIQVVLALVVVGSMVFGGYVMYLFTRALAHIMLTLSQIETDLRGGSARGATSTPPTQADWFSDPKGRFEKRYFDGTKWTDQVWSNGVRSQDPMV